MTTRTLLMIASFTLINAVVASDEQTVFHAEMKEIATAKHVLVKAKVRRFDGVRGTFDFNGESSDPDVLKRIKTFLGEMTFTSYAKPLPGGISEGLWIDLTFSNQLNGLGETVTVSILFSAVSTKSVDAMFDAASHPYLDELGKLIYVDQFKKWKWGTEKKREQ